MSEATEEFIESGKSTRFGGDKANPRYTEAKPHAKPWSVRNSLKDMAHSKIPDDVDVDDLTEYQLAKKILPTKTPTLIQIAAARQIAKIAKGGGNIEFVTEQIDGKIATTNINRDFQALQGMTDEELEAIANGINTANEGGGAS